MFSLESPHRGDSNKYTQFTIFNTKKNITLNNPKNLQLCDFSKGLEKEFETAVVNEPSVFEHSELRQIFDKKTFTLQTDKSMSTY